MKSKIPIKITRKIVKNLSLSIDPYGNIKVTAPREFPTNEIQKWVESKKKWIYKHIEQINNQKTVPVEIGNHTKAKARNIIIALVKNLSISTQKPVNKIYISSAKTRWGTCSSKGNIRINWRLINAPQEILEYVIYHELCHLKHPNHSKAFWTEV